MNIEKCLPHFAIESDLFIFTIMIDIIILWDKIWEVGGGRRFLYQWEGIK